MTIKYVLCPGNVRSQKDSQIWHINAKQLAKLYKVQLSQCIVQPRDHELKGWQAPDNAVFLHPREDGNYNLAESKP